MAVVRLPDGEQVRFPDDMPEAEIKALIEHKFPNEIAKQREAPAYPAIPGSPQSAFFRSGIENIPILGHYINEGLDSGQAAVTSLFTGKDFGETKRDVTRFNNAVAEGEPIAKTVGSVVGNVAPFAAAGAVPIAAKALGMTGKIIPQIVLGGTSAAAIEGADKLVEGASLKDAATSAGYAFAGGAAFPIVAKGASAVWGGIKGLLSSAAKAGVDDEASSALAGIASKMFENADNSGIGIKPQAFDNFVSEVQAALKGKRPANPLLDEKAVGVLGELEKVQQELAPSAFAPNGQLIGIGQLHDLRQIAQKAAQSTEGRDQMFSKVVIKKLDDMIARLNPADVAGGADPAGATKALQDGIGTWFRAKKVHILEEAIYRAQHAASGKENGLRAAFRSILNNADERELFSEPELKLIEQVVDGTVGANLAKLIGKFGFGGGNASNMLGGTMGVALPTAMGGPAVGAVAGVGTAGARALSEGLTSKAALNALRMTGGEQLRNALPMAPRRTTQEMLRVLGQGVSTPFAPAALGALTAQYAN